MRPSVALLLVCAVGCDREVDVACERYIACQQAYDEATGVPPADTSFYQLDGACWNVGDARARDRCIVECTENTAILKEAADELGVDVADCEPTP